MTPSSRSLGIIEMENYTITLAAWDGGYGESFEIGIRRRIDSEFWLLQGNWTERTLPLAGQAVKALLDTGFTPEMVRSVFP